MPPGTKRPDAKLGKSKKKDVEQLTPQDYVPPPPPMPGDDFAMPVREVVKPDNQLHLTEAELNEEVAKMLTANNPAAPKNVARFNMKERTYKFEPMVEQTIVHYATDGWLLYKGSDEAKRQMDMEKMETEAAARFQAEVDRAHHDKRDDDDAPDDSRQLRNQFNFSERAAQTINYPLRDRETFTEPPPTVAFSGSCTQWGIFDDYIRDLERQKFEETIKAKAGKKGAGAGATAAAAAAAAQSHLAHMAHRDVSDPLHSDYLKKASYTLDRMVNQNMFEEIAMDFKYWEDASDTFRPTEGTLLPLWRFGSEKSRRRQVTAMCWNPQYLDLFAVGYGSYDFLKQASGLINIYSLKNPSHPEFSLSTESGVMCLDFHPEFASLLAVGCYDGSVLVFDVAKRTGVPIYASTVQTGKHNDPVWNICWQVDESQKALQFVSISSDGNVNLWTMNKSELTHESLMKLSVGGGGPGGAGSRPNSSRAATKTGTTRTGGGSAATATVVGDEAAGPGAAGGCCLDFKKAAGQEHIYLVGTEEGAIHKCSKAYSSEYLSTYLGHSLAVYAVKWNLIHHRIFLSASADWSVRLWDSAQPSKPVMSFDLNDSVGDIAWSPYSATVFAAITDDGKVHVFDINENKLLPVCSQKVVKKAKLTKLVFNPKWPIILVGDDKGCVTSFKLSPNLRKRSVPEKGAKETAEDLECAKLDKVLLVASKSDPDTATTHAAATLNLGGSFGSTSNSTGPIAVA